MKRICLVAGLLALGSPAQAGSSISFSVGGHRIHIEAPRHCRSTSCASVSVSGIYDSRRKRDRFEDDDVAPANPVTPAPANVSPPATVPPAPSVIVSAPPTVYKPAATATQAVAALPPPPPVQQVAIPLPPPPPVAAPQVSRVSQEVEREAADTPVGDWQTGGKGAVRITRCGNALCGYVLNSASNDRGEAVLINMKSKDDGQWTGSVYSHDSGDTFYGTMNLKSPNRLRVEACALGRFYCSGNNWSRIDVRAESLVTSRQVPAEPRS